MMGVGDGANSFGRVCTLASLNPSNIHAGLECHVGPHGPHYLCSAVCEDLKIQDAREIVSI
jgi:hypothetical protein